MLGQQRWRFLKSLLPGILLLGLLSGFTACSQNSAVGGFSIKDRQALGKLLPVDSVVPLEQRVAEIPDSILNVWQRMDAAMNPQAKHYKPYQLTADEQRQFTQAIATLPLPWRKIMQQKLSHFFFVDQLLGGGITDWIITKENSRAYTMILNPALFKASAKEWLEYRENAFFKKGPYRISVEGMEDVSALQFILWHEVAHLIDFETQHTPINDALLRQHFGFDKTSTPFTRDVWKAGSSGAPQPLPAFDFPARKNLNPYHMNLHKEQMENELLKQTFAEWSQTPFVTIYAASSWAEDYADFAAFIIALSRTGKVPHWLLTKNGQRIAEYSPLKHPMNKSRFIDR